MRLISTGRDTSLLFSKHRCFTRTHESISHCCDSPAWGNGTCRRLNPDRSRSHVSKEYCSLERNSNTGPDPFIATSIGGRCSGLSSSLRFAMRIVPIEGGRASIMFDSNESSSRAVALAATAFSKYWCEHVCVCACYRDVSQKGCRACLKGEFLDCAQLHRKYSKHAQAGVYASDMARTQREVGVAYEQNMHVLVSAQIQSKILRMHVCHAAHRNFFMCALAMHNNQVSNSSLCMLDIHTVQTSDLLWAQCTE